MHKRLKVAQLEMAGREVQRDSAYGACGLALRSKPLVMVGTLDELAA